MSTEYIRRIAIKSDGVYLNSKSSNDDLPYRTWRCVSLTEIYQNEGQKGLDREIVKMLCEYAEIKGDHPSVERYRPCLFARKDFCANQAKILNAAYMKLTLEDIDTKGLPDEQKTDGMKAYRRFAEREYNKYYATLAEFATPLPQQQYDSRARSR
jgi:hypothetical protein